MLMDHATAALYRWMKKKTHKPLQDRAAQWHLMQISMNPYVLFAAIIYLQRY